MTDKSDPWQFHNIDKALVSTDGSQKLVYYDLSEIAMGAPIGGPCFLESDGHPKIKINDWCAGPPVWEKAGRLLAIPIWTRDAESGITQRIGIVDTEKLTLTVFNKKFRVLDLRSFDRTIVAGYDSLLHNPEKILFDIEEEDTEAIVQLV